MKAEVASLGLFFGLTVLDVFVVETYFRPSQNWGEIYRWHYLYWSLIVGLPLVAAYFVRSLVPLLVWVAFFFGLEDTAFYGLQGYIPEKFWGVSIAGFPEPNVGTVLILNVLGLALIAGLYTFLHGYGE